MKTIINISVGLIFTLAAMGGWAQNTPEAVIGQCPSLPSPQQWAAGKTEAFQAKIEELQGKLSAQMSNSMSDAMQNNLEAAPIQQQQPKMPSEKEMQKAMADMENMMSLLGITEADMQKIAKMSDKQVEDFMRKRMAEKGIDPAKFAGNDVISEAEYREEQRREQQAQADGEAMIKAQETLETYMEQSQIASQQIGEAEQHARQKLAALAEKYEPQIAKAKGEANQWEEVMRGAMKKEELESRQKKADALVLEYKTQAYQIWSEYILNAQGRLKVLLQYAAASDAAKAKMPAMTGNAATDRMQRVSHNAINVAAQYLNITASVPEITN